jgi:SAM-dependent methyltransferase
MYDPKLYRLLHTGTPGDRAFYTAECPAGAEVLELGCGYGRVTMDLLRNGASVTGLDVHDGMLECLRKAARALPKSNSRRLRIVHGDMRRFDLDAAFDKILIPYNGLLCLLSDQDIIDCLKSVAKHLKPTGELLFDIYNVPLFLDESPSPDDTAFEPIASIEDKEGRTVHIYEASRPHRDPQRFDTVYRHVIDDNSGEAYQVEHVIEQRCIYKEDLPSLLGEAGLTLISMTADFRDTPVDDEIEQIVVRAMLDRF